MEVKRILIVDDEPNIVMSLEYAFKKKSYEVFIARDGTEAFEIAKEQSPQVILLDIMMPKMDGYETLKKIKEVDHLKNTNVIFLSAKSKTNDIEKGMSLGADDYVTKPFSVKKLIEKVEAIVLKNTKQAD
ncbi:Response regulator receiver domain-containing protein [Tenacibaculum sp. MAR_2009_124]|uniref:response regulator transcription factor n=1 Tax=Tenacibaculum sp. MAR_2009_124 TaxID=1250059 RepID=UPI000897D957|nr:response regulator [Tenacibaculum sp. MAR_2009_124]SEB48040.1 Response regulator receiver domain-containing protein [Tenacibaculum sp. MAR_2009_124]